MMPDTVMDQCAGRNAINGYEIATEEGLSKNVGIILQELYDMEENLYLDSKAENREYYEKEFFSEKIIYYTYKRISKNTAKNQCTYHRYACIM